MSDDFISLNEALQLPDVDASDALRAFDGDPLRRIHRSELYSRPPIDRGRAVEKNLRASLDRAESLDDAQRDKIYREHMKAVETASGDDWRTSKANNELTPPCKPEFNQLFPDHAQTDFGMVQATAQKVATQMLHEGKSRQTCARLSRARGVLSRGGGRIGN